MRHGAGGEGTTESVTGERIKAGGKKRTLKMGDSVVRSVGEVTKDEMENLAPCKPKRKGGNAERSRTKGRMTKK